MLTVVLCVMREHYLPRYAADRVGGAVTRNLVAVGTICGAARHMRGPPLN